MDLVVALGGTGQLVLHYLAQWHLLGLEADTGPMRALVIDQDQPLASLRFAQSLLAGEAPHALHPARALFDRATLAQEVGEGLYGRPCLAPVLWPRHGESIRQAI